jgi:hypothetical protein
VVDAVTPMFDMELTDQHTMCLLHSVVRIPL